MFLQGFFKIYALIPCLFFNNIEFKHEFHSILAFYLNHKQFCCSNQDHKKKHHAQVHKKYPGKTYHHQKNLSHKRVLINPRRLEPKRGDHFSQEAVLDENSKLTWKIWSLNGEFTFTYTRLNLSTEVSIGTTETTSLAHNIININQINYLLH